MDAQGIINLRKQAANNIGITFISLVPPRKFDGSAAHFGQLSPADQIKVSDEMAKMIATDPDPTKYTAIQLDLARRRVSSPLYGQPMQATSLIAVTGELVASGQMQDLLLKSAGRYVSQVTGTAIVAGIIVLGVLWQINQPKRRRA